MMVVVMSTATLSIVVMVMLMVVSAATLSVMIVVMVLLMIVATALFVMVMVVMLMLIMIVSAALFVMVMMVMMLVLLMIVATAALLVMMMVMMLVLFLKHLLLQRYRMLHNLYQFLSVKVLDRSCDDSSIFVQVAQKLQRLLNFLLCCNISTAHDNSTCVLDLVVKKLTEVLHVHFAFLGINNSSIAVQFNINFILNTLYSLDNVRKFTNS